MLQVLPVPVPVETPRGRRFARFALLPRNEGDPCWVIYREETGGWFTAILPASGGAF